MPDPVAGAGLKEVERKYEVPIGTDLPDLTDESTEIRTGAVTRVTLTAVYFDTLTAALARQGVTLRHRTGGSDQGWHLKVPVRGDERRELRRPLAALEDGPPAPLLGVVRGALRHHDVAPVARLTTERSEHPLLDAAGTVLAVVCDDLVTGSLAGPTGRANLQTWREWEVELVEGGPAVLDDIGRQLREAGASPAAGRTKLSHVLGPPLTPRASATSDAVDAFQALVRERARELVHELVARDMVYRLDRPDSVHRLRITVRRLRALLATCRPVLAAETVNDLQVELRWFSAALSAERDADVLRHDLLHDMVPTLPGPVVDGRLVTGIRELLDARCRDGHRTARRAMAGKRYLALLDRLETFADEPVLPGSSRPATSQLRHLLRRDGRRLRRAIRAARVASAGEPRNQSLHEARKKAKRLRYAAELATPVLGRKARRLARAAKDLQDVLGDHQDEVVAVAALSDLAESAADAAVSFTLGRLYAAEQQSVDRGVDGLQPAWHAISVRLKDCVRQA